MSGKNTRIKKSNSKVGKGITSVEEYDSRLVEVCRSDDDVEIVSETFSRKHGASSTHGKSISSSVSAGHHASVVQRSRRIDLKAKKTKNGDVLEEKRKQTEQDPGSLRMINIRIRPHEDGLRYMFRMADDSTFAVLIEKYHEKMKAPPGSFRFLFDGRRIEKNDTPRKLEVQSGDTIDALILASGGTNHPFIDKM